VSSSDPPLPPPTVTMVARFVDGLSRSGLVVAGGQARVFAVAPPTAEEALSWDERGRPAPTALVVKDAALSDPLFVPGAGRRLMSGVDGTPLARPLIPAVAGTGEGIVAIASGGEATRWSTWTEGVPPTPRPPAPAGVDEVTVLVD